MLPDREATDSRMAVALSVRNAGGKNKGPDKQPDYSRMSDSEARAAVEKDFGYTPNF